MDYYFIMAVLVILGAVLAFDVRGISTRIREDSPLLFPGSRWMRDRLPNPARIVGWIFFVPGMLMMILLVVFEAIHIVKFG
jgi:hypothetical protein